MFYTMYYAIYRIFLNKILFLLVIDYEKLHFCLEQLFCCCFCCCRWPSHSCCRSWRCCCCRRRSRLRCRRIDVSALKARLPNNNNNCSSNTSNNNATDKWRWRWRRRWTWHQNVTCEAPTTRRRRTAACGNLKAHYVITLFTTCGTDRRQREKALLCVCRVRLSSAGQHNGTDITVTKMKLKPCDGKATKTKAATPQWASSGSSSSSIQCSWACALSLALTLTLLLSAGARRHCSFFKSNESEISAALSLFLSLFPLTVEEMK